MTDQQEPQDPSSGQGRPLEPDQPSGADEGAEPEESSAPQRDQAGAPKPGESAAVEPDQADAPDAGQADVPEPHDGVVHEPGEAVTPETVGPVKQMERPASGPVKPVPMAVKATPTGETAPTPEAGEQPRYVDDPVSKWWVGIIIAAFAVVFGWAVLLGGGGLLSDAFKPGEPVVEPTASASPNLAPSPSPSATVVPTVAPTLVPTPASTAAPTSASSAEATPIPTEAVSTPSATPPA